MRNKFLKYLERTVDCKNSSFLLAVSGGVDSMVLFDLFKESSLNFSVAHCNFSLRGKDSDQDQLFVKSICEKTGFHCFIKKFDTKKIASDNTISVQMAARKLRYNWFDNLLNEYKFDYIVTAHHFNDSVETVLFNIARGTGIFGLKGILVKENKLIRPLLNFHKNDIIEFAKKNHIEFREDSSNDDEKYKRNRIRKSIIPQFQNLNSNFIESFKNTIYNFQSAGNIYSHFIDNEKKRCCSIHNNILNIDIKLLLMSIEPKTLLFEIIKEYGFTDIDSVFKVINSQSGKSFYSENFILIKDRDKLCISRLSLKQNIKITKACKLINQPVKLSLKLVDKFKFEENKNKSSAILSYEKLKFPLTLRTWKNGDWFMPSGMNGKKKLSDYFIDNKINRLLKEKTLLICSNDDIIWVIGHRIDERYKATSKTKKMYIANLLEK